MKIQFTLLFCFIVIPILSSQTTLSGSLIDAKTGEELMYAYVMVYKDGALLTGTTTDWTGEYHFDKLDPATYDIVFSYVGYKKNKVSGVKLEEDRNNYFDETLSNGVTLDMVVVTALGIQKGCRLICGCYSCT
ncbi:MAG: hypothetical protein ACI85O_001546 [Saprospiraceae bacterium]|jgi:hypothetical protein